MNTGTVWKTNSNTEMRGIIAPPLAVSATIGDYIISSGSDFPIVVTGIDIYSNEKWTISAYPTLMTNTVTITCNNSANSMFKVDVFNMLGNQVSLLDLNNRYFKDIVNIDVSQLGPPGMYFFRLSSSTSNFSKTIRLIKIN